MSAINVVLKAIDNYSGVLLGLNQGLEIIGKTIRTVATAADLLTGGLGLAFKALSSIASVALSPLTTAFELLTSTVTYLYDKVTQVFSMIYDGIKGVLSYAWDSIKSVADFLWTGFKDALGRVYDEVVYVFDTAYEKVKQFGTYAFESTLKVGNQFEQLGVKMETIFGSSGAAEQAIKWAAEFGRTTPLTLDQVASAMTKLKTYGFDPMDGSMKKIGDAAFALGADFDGIVTALGQMQLKGKVTSEELMQLAERNIPAFQYLKEEFNLTAKQMENIGAAGLNVDEAIKVIIDRMGKDFEGAMQKASKTAEGMWSNIEDTIMVFQKALLDTGVWDAYLRQLSSVKSTVENVFNIGLASSWGSVIKDVLGNAFDLFDKVFKFVTQNASQIGQMFGRIFNEMIDFWDSIWEASQKFIKGFSGGWNIFDEIVKQVKSFYGWMKEIVGLLPQFAPVVKDVFALVKDGVNFLIKEGAPAIKKLPDLIRKAFSAGSDGIKDMWSAFNKYWPQIKNSVNLLWDSLVLIFNTVETRLTNTFGLIRSTDVFSKINSAIVITTILFVELTNAVFDFADSGVIGKLFDLAIKGFNNLAQGIELIRTWIPEIVKGIEGYYTIVVKVFDEFVRLFTLLTKNKTLVADFFVDMFKIATGYANNFGRLLESVIKLIPQYTPAAIAAIQSISDAAFGAIKGIGSLFAELIKGINYAIFKVQETLDATAVKIARNATPLGYAGQKIGIFKSTEELIQEKENTIRIAEESASGINNALNNITAPSFEIKLPDTTEVVNNFQKLTNEGIKLAERGMSGFNVAVNEVGQSLRNVSSEINSFAGFSESLGGEGSSIRIKVDDSELAKISEKTQAVKVNVDTKAIDDIKAQLTVKIEDTKKSSTIPSQDSVLQWLVNMIESALISGVSGSSTPLALTA